ncbi:3,4-dihydroxy-2-butanone-4-phosphate synthase [Rhodococcus wratislaviensis]|uniref:3,4-dihydroxy-2-butanone 4-phosphate synthase/GTP cyclohydrolase II n=1 Tax=Rhodococcus wratislaviensis NBRC 100605 TaxID=1219028 RepID=X0QX13_RHOWR|nr:3,4-dihydroxy-2-butanone-4-phosphate synthase [Rhodococcus wratislaviensis]GAF43140.1 3,4-dihydroxy-2-butanone 4-phosphate synthase/GTP cyclohydrolase II [Rhodococcus wratislaviensis NBRC 100605]
MKFDTVDCAVQAIACGQMVVVLDHQDRENEADLIMAAEFVDTDAIAFYLEHTSGFLCTAITEERAHFLRLPMMVENNSENQRTAFLDSVDALRGITTGISAADRATTIRLLADPSAVAEDLARPGHVMPLQARIGGVLARPGHTESGVDLCQLAGVQPAALICELTTADRRGMLCGNDAIAFARTHNLAVISIADLIDTRERADSTLMCSGRASVPTAYGTFAAVAYRAQNNVEHLALVLGDVNGGGAVPVRVHSECMTGDLFGSLRCDCGDQLDASLKVIQRHGCGVLIYVNGHEGRGIGLGRKLQAYRMQEEQQLDTVDANTAIGCPVDDRDYTSAAAIISDLGIQSVALMTNNPDKSEQLAALGVAIASLIPLQTQPTTANISYLTTKRDRMRHNLDLPTSI